MRNISRPESGECAPYFHRYIDLVGHGEFLEELQKNTEETEKCFLGLKKEKHNYRYAPEKWTVKEVFMHIIDMERVFAYRALVCARGDKTMLPLADEILYAANVDVTNRTMESMMTEFMATRRSTAVLFENMTEAQSRFVGTGATHPFTARALGYMVAGHGQHHLNVLQERYA